MRLVVGRIGRPHGVRGEVTIDVRTDDPGVRFAAGATLLTDPDSAGPLTVTSSRNHGDRLLVRFSGVKDRDGAEALRGTNLLVDSQDLAPTGDPDQFHDHELRGLRVETSGGEDVGVVSDVLHHAQDLLVIEDDAGTQRLVPFVAALVPEVDTANGRMTIDPPPGLLDLES
ncbi:16S rRNA processing protein RimM [Haloactinospora alba]|uniref:Ribosome maturation factor RimM n=1 Tax=Haloactinospora alba TaxID=405555 RepID=A0A543NFT9_9ACTN|nr:ribosome maturation factor RimM [Haloactinospora alba]TQN30712.1 16S rRNA processing protein RimM [Haloactinospora alba]